MDIDLHLVLKSHNKLQFGMEGAVEVNTCNTYFPESYYILRETTSSSDARSRSMKRDKWSSRQSAPPPVQHGTMVEYSCPYKRETQGRNIRASAVWRNGVGPVAVPTIDMTSPGIELAMYGTGVLISSWQLEPLELCHVSEWYFFYCKGTGSMPRSCSSVESTLQCNVLGPIHALNA
jgi:hypothetical protein